MVPSVADSSQFDGRSRNQTFAIIRCQVRRQRRAARVIRQELSEIAEEAAAARLDHNWYSVSTSLLAASQGLSPSEVTGDCRGCVTTWS